MAASRNHAGRSVRSGMLENPNLSLALPQLRVLHDVNCVLYLVVGMSTYFKAVEKSRRKRTTHPISQIPTEIPLRHGFVRTRHR